MSAKPKLGQCPTCEKNGFIMPLHGEMGGPMMCLQCGMDWHAKHSRRRKFGRVVAKAVRLFLESGGKMDDAKKIVDVVAIKRIGFGLEAFGATLDPAGYADDALGTEIGDITSELLTDILQLTHPDHHPPERQDLAKRVTQDLLALKPFAFPAPKPKPTKPFAPPKRDDSVKSQRATHKEPSRPVYPCQLCADTVPYFYCKPCRAEWDKRQKAERDARRAKQREGYRRRQERKRARRPKKPCTACGANVESIRKDAIYCSPVCRQKAHRKRVTDKNGSAAGTTCIRNGADRDCDS